MTCNVDATLGAIRPGDLLVSSPNAGYAVRSDAPAPGTIVGKALEALAGDRHDPHPRGAAVKTAALLMAVASIASSGLALAQQSASHRLTEHVFNAGGHPAAGVIVGSVQPPRIAGRTR